MSAVIQREIDPAAAELIRNRRRVHVAGVSVAMAQVLRQLRGNHGWSQEELARRAGLSHGVVTAAETARTPPTLESLVRLGEALGMPAWKLLRRAEAALLMDGDTE